MTIALNEDNSHFFFTRAEEELTPDGLDEWLDQYAGTQVAELLLCPNAQRSNVPSQARQTVWDGFDPAQGNDQPFFAGMQDKPFIFPEGARQHMRRWFEHVWTIHNQGIDPYAHWIARCRRHGISPWLSMRMNDVHYVNEPQHPIHDRFWKEHPEYRRDPTHDQYNGRCFDYGLPQVRAYQLAYAQELISRYDIDGFELDWMRNPFHFKPGEEEAGCAVLTEFVGQVRGMLDRRQREVGHAIELGARVPSRPHTAGGLGMDAATWARQGLVSRLTATPFFVATEFDMPIEQWKELLQGTSVKLAAGLEISVRMDAGAYKMAHNLQTLRGAAVGLLDRGADQVYLFNFFDRYPFGVTRETYHGSVAAEAYRRALREIGSPDTMAGKCRRHVFTSPDIYAPGEKKAPTLPRDCPAGERAQFSIPIGPAPLARQRGQVRIAAEPKDAAELAAWDVYVNGARCSDTGKVTHSSDATEPLLAFNVPAGALKRSQNLIEAQNTSQMAKQLVWVELAVSDSDGKWPASDLETTSLYPGWGRW